jgi:hypothetical protein
MNQGEGHTVAQQVVPLAPLCQVMFLHITQ